MEEEPNPIVLDSNNQEKKNQAVKYHYYLRIIKNSKIQAAKSHQINCQ